jgi:hypothetical protein
MPIDNPESLTLTQMEQVGRLLAPQFREAIRPDLHQLRDEIATVFTSHQNQVSDRFLRLETRVATLEKLGWKLIGALSLALLLLHVAAELLRVLHIA